MIIQSADVAQVQASNGTCGFGTGDPSWGMYVQKAIGDWWTPVQMHDAGYKYITYYETFGTATCFLTELGAPTTEGDNSIYRTYWSWNYIDTNGGAFRWAGPQNYFDAEDFCGPYTRRHPVYGAGGRAMTYPDGTPATGYFDNDNTDPRKSRVLDAACSKDILGGINHSLSYRDESAGNPLREGGLLPVTVNGQSHLAGHADFAKDAACPMWIDQQRSSILYSVARGQIDGIWSDNFSPWDNFGYQPVKVAFGDWSVARFRDYLSTHFTTAELTAMGVSNVTTFDVRTALRGKLTALGGTSTNLGAAKWNDSSWLNDSLWRAYKIYKRQIGTEALTNYYNVTKDAAAQMGVSDFAVFGNDIPVFSLGYCRGTLDAVSTELSPGSHPGTGSRGFMMPPVGRFGPAYKLGREHAKSRLLNVWMYLESAYKENPGAVNAIYYEMLANHTLPMLHPGNPGTTQDATINGGFTNFVKNSRATFGGRDALTDVGIYYSTSSVLAYMTPAGFLDANNQPATAAYNGWGTALGNLHYQYRPIPEWKLTSEALAKLRVLVIPNAEVLDSADVANIIDPWVRAGGLLIVTGNSGARKGESGNFDPYTNFSLSGLTGVTKLSGAPATKLTTVGSGKVYYIKNNIGLSYFNASTATDRSNLIAGFSTAMNQVLGTNKTILAAVTSIPDTVGLNVYEDPAARRLFIDVNNYDVNLATDAVTATPASTFTVAAPAWLASASIANIRVKVLSPTIPAPTVTVTKSGTDRIQVVLGAVTNYASIVVSEETSLTWNGGGGSPSDSSGIWNATNTNWWGTTAAVWSDLYDGVFGVGTGSNTPYTISLESGFTPTVGNLIFANHAYTLSNGSINLGAASEIQVDVGRTATINSTLAGASVGLTKTGAGNLTLTGVNTYTGDTAVNQGTLMISAAGSITSASTISINASGTLALGQAAISNSLNLNGGRLSVFNLVDNTGTGGTISFSGGNVIHTFTATGASVLDVPIAITGASTLVVAGGGGGGSQYGGGGGAGGLISTAETTIASGSNTVTVGAGGSGGSAGGAQNGGLGGNSVFGTATALGGGGGGGNDNNATSGGSGGGAGFGAGVGALGTAGQGNSGGYLDGNLGDYGGGGGAGGAATGQTGGDGLQYSISGTPTWYAGGGGGINAIGGLGGGSTGSTGSGLNASSSSANTGGGGGGAWSAGGGNGGSGIVIVSYAHIPNAINATTLSGTINVTETSTLDAVRSGGQITVASTITGAAGINIASSYGPGGVVVFNGANTYTGGTTVSGGTLSVTGAGQLYSNLGWNNAVVTIQSGGTLEVDRWDGLGALGQLNYAQSNIVINGGTIRYIGNSNGISQGPGFTIGANGATLQSNASSGQSWNINFDDRQLYYAIASDNAGLLTLAGSGNGLISKVIPGSGGVSKTGNGTWTLSGANTYTGDTTITAGSLAVNGSSIADTNKLLISGGTVDLSGAEAVHTLFFGAVQQAAGTYSATGAGGTIASTNFSGAGTLIVTSGPAAGYASWMAPFITGGLTGDTTPAGDPDNDSINNLLEYALNGNPSISDPSILPTLVVTATDFEFTYSRLDFSLADTVQIFEYGSILPGWAPVLIPAGPSVSTVGIATVTITNTGASDSVKVSIPKSANIGGKLFGRLRIIK